MYPERYRIPGNVMRASEGVRFDFPKYSVLDLFLRHPFMTITIASGFGVEQFHDS